MAREHRLPVLAGEPHSVFAAAFDAAAEAGTRQHLPERLRLPPLEALLGWRPPSAIGPSYFLRETTTGM